MVLSFTEGSIGGDIEKIDLRQLEAFYSRKSVMAQRDDDPIDRERQGSNGIAIAPKLTTGGGSLLLINPHTSWYFRSELQMSSDEGLDAYGAATWGQFFIYQGFNPHAGWMHTSSGIDNVDVPAARSASCKHPLPRLGRTARDAQFRDFPHSPRANRWVSGRPLDRFRHDGQAGAGAAAELPPHKGD
jgi:hypothetical protein